MKVVIKSIKRQYILDDAEYAWIKDNLNKPLDVLNICLSSEGTVHSFGLSTGDYDIFDGVIALFVGEPGDFCCSNGIKYELVGNLQMSN